MAEDDEDEYIEEDEEGRGGGHAVGALIGWAVVLALGWAAWTTAGGLFGNKPSAGASLPCWWLSSARCFSRRS